MKQFLEENLKKDLPSKIFLTQICTLLEDKRIDDPKYLPFYYWLGKLISPINVLEIGFDFGLISTVFFKSCKSVQNFIILKENSEFSPKMGINNVKVNYKNKIKFYNNINDIEVKNLDLDLVLINEKTSYDKCKDYLELGWNNLNFEGIIVLEHVNLLKKVYEDFCKIKNREKILINTKFGVGIIKR